MKIATIFFFCVCFLSSPGFTQIRNYKTWDPSSDSVRALEGQGWIREQANFYSRLPAKAEQTVRKEVWNLAQHTAGLLIRFVSDADEIVIKYAVRGGLQMPHMPATGVSGIDLYAKDSDGNWLWCGGKYAFGDTISYRFTGLRTRDQYGNGFEYHLYLPLYNSVKWLQISVPTESAFMPLPIRREKPVVVYGTSIAQGGCASRPGLAWTSILGRRLDRTIINLGFSGNGRLEKEVTSLVAELDASVYVLDCLPNLTASSGDGVKKRVAAAVQELQNKRPGVPIVLTEHDSYTDEHMIPAKQKQYRDVNTALREVYDSLVGKKVANLYLLTKEEIGQDIETTVDGTHPNDIGMMRYAEAYERLLRKIMHEPLGNISTTTPVSQRREPKIYEWYKRHDSVLLYNQKTTTHLMLIGNSITHYWAGSPSAPRVWGQTSWKKYFESRHPVNLGFGWDRIENVLWRVYHGELDHVAPAQIVLMIGTNNLSLNSNDEIVAGLQFLVDAIQTRQPAARILLMGILPRRAMEERIAALNSQLAKARFSKNVRFADTGALLLNTGKKIDEKLFSDGLHPNEKGYELLGKFIVAQIDKR